METELHSAFVWDCDECGAENFERAIEGNIDEAALENAEPQVLPELLAIDAKDHGDGMMEAPLLVQRISIVPEYVICRSCRKTFTTTVPTIEDDDES